MSKFHLQTAQKRTILFLQGSVETRNRCCGHYIYIVLLGIYSGVSLPKIIKFDWEFAKLYQFNINHGNAHFLGHPVCGVMRHCFIMLTT